MNSIRSLINFLKIMDNIFKQHKEHRLFNLFFSSMCSFSSKLFKKKHIMIINKNFLLEIFNKRKLYTTCAHDGFRNKRNISEEDNNSLFINQQKVFNCLIKVKTCKHNRHHQKDITANK